VDGDPAEIIVYLTKRRYSVPHLVNFSHQIRGCKIFSVLDLQKAFLQVLVAFEDRLKTIIQTSFELFEFNTNAIQTLQLTRDVSKVSRLCSIRTRFCVRVHRFKG